MVKRLSQATSSTASWLVVAIVSSFGAFMATSSLAAQAEPVAGKRLDGQRVIRVSVKTAEQLEAVTTIAEDIWSCRVGLGPLDLQVTPQQQAAIAGLGLDVRVLIPDVQRLLDDEQAHLAQTARQRDAAWFSDYKTYDQVSAQVNTLVAARPDMATRILVGKSFQNRDIFAIRIAAPGAPADQPTILITGTQHAREWASVMTVMYFADQLVSTYSSSPATQSALSKFAVIIVPICNPDGYVFTWTGSNNRLWRKNRRSPVPPSIGVDLNRNWGFQWGGAGASSSPSNDTYRGPSAFSEPETQVLRDFITARPFIRAGIDYHAYSQLIMGPWGYTTASPANPGVHNWIEQQMAIAIRATFGQVYNTGPIATTIYLASGNMVDWITGSRRAYGFTVELRDTGQYGFVLPAAQILPTAQENWNGLLTFFTNLYSVPQVTTPAPAFVQAYAGEPLSITISDPQATLTPGSVNVFTRVGSATAFTAAPMNASGGGQFSAPLPILSCGQSLSYFVQYTMAGSRTVVWPASDQTVPWSASAGQVYLTAGVPTLAACTYCPADLTGAGGPPATPDGDLSVEDFIAFLNAFTEDCPTNAAAPCSIADITGAGGLPAPPDGQLSVEDFITFLNSFTDGCAVP